jgi:3-hydroxyisobutyrate dehydrogenase
MPIGFIGLGTMGARMAGNLQQAGHKLVVHDIRKEAAAPHLAAGAAFADTPRALAQQCDVILTSLRSRPTWRTSRFRPTASSPASGPARLGSISRPMRRAW